MATTQYFPHYSNARNDEKILSLRMKYGMEGYGIYFAILERLLDSTDYRLSTNYSLIAFDFRVDTGKIKSIVEDFDLFEFTDDMKWFYSIRFVEHMNYKDDISKKRAEAGRKGGLQKAKNAESEAKEEQEPSKSLANAKQNPSIKRNKTKQNNTINNNCAFSVFAKAWTAYPNKKGKSAVSKKSKEELEKLGIDKVLLAIKHYKQDVENQRSNGFDGLNYLNGSTFFNGRYADFIDPGSVTPLKPKPGNKFHNFQGSTDFTADDLENLAKKKMENYGVKK